MDPTSPDYRGIARRRTSLLVYGHGRDYSAPARKRLLQTLSVWEQDASGARWKAFEAALQDVDPLGRGVLRLPGWADPDLVAAAWPRGEWTDAMRPWPARAAAVHFRSVEFPYRDRDQARIFDYLVGQGSFARMAGASAYLVVADTAKGKSYCAIRAWCRYGDVLLGIFAQGTHLENFRAELLKFTDLTEADILVASDGRESMRRATRRGLDRYKAILVLHGTAWRCAEDAIDDGHVTGANELVTLIQAAGVGTIVADECHLELKSLAVLEMLTNVGRWFFLSASPQRTEWQEERVLRQVLPLADGLWVKSVPRVQGTMVRFDSRPGEADLAKSINQRGHFDVPAYFDYLLRQPRYAAWEEMATTMVARCFADGATGVGVVVGGRLEFLDAVLETMAAAFPGRTVGNFSSRIKKPAARMVELDRDIVVTTEKSFGGSVNPPRMSHMVMCVPFSSEVYSKQITGRLRGLDGGRCVLVDLWDAGFPNTREQYRLRRRAYRKLFANLDEEEYHA